MILLLLFGLSEAMAQGLGVFVSPGELSAVHADLEGLLQCVECHEPGAGVTAARCTACHEGVAKQLADDRGFHAGKSVCGDCHPDHQGRNFKLVKLEGDDFDHSVTGFDLEGAHEDAECSDCHTEEGVWTGLDPTCKACHEDEEPHGAPDGRTEMLLACASCHNTFSWEVVRIAQSKFDHTSTKQVDFVLTGKHVDVTCVDCHEDAQFVPTPSDACTDCHERPHRAAALAGSCENCHTTEGWGRVKGFDHAVTGFELIGQHVDVSCDTCHGRSRVARLPHETCADCHTDIHQGQFQPRTCDGCHTVEREAFKIPDYDHSTTEFPLRGPHAEVACADCHGALPDSTFAGLDHQGCDSCHEDAHNGQFEPTPCQTCHDEGSGGWTVQDFDHARTRFPLKGKHGEVACAECHPNDVFRVPFESCSDCHDSHPHGPQPAACTECHAETGWTPPIFDHASTAFPLAEQHRPVPCKECHALDDFAAATSSCADCHDRPRNHYDGACETCHTEPSWTPASLGGADHAATGFPLEGFHAQVGCIGCHPEGQARSNAQPTCISCHDDDDIHRHMLGDSCQDCHAPTGWLHTRFRHQQTGWPLRGAHRLASCIDCHAVRYIGTPTDCWRCHETEAPRDILAHQSAFFAQCDECHRPFTWDVVRAVH